jgi:hypothetical protein
MLTRQLLLALALAAAAGVASGAAAQPAPARIVAQAQAEWLENLRASALDGDRSASFPSPSRAILLRRLRLAQREFYPLFDRSAMKARCDATCPDGFQIVSVHMLHVLQPAPLIVIRSDEKQAMARAVAKIVDLVDPRRPTSENPSGYAYEGYSRSRRRAAASPTWRRSTTGGHRTSAAASGPPPRASTRSRTDSRRGCAPGCSPSPPPPRSRS